MSTPGINQPLLFAPFCPQVCVSLWEHEAAASGKGRLIKHGEGLLKIHCVYPCHYAPPLPYTVYNMTICLPSVFPLSSSLSSHLCLLLGVTSLSSRLNGKPWSFLFLEGNLMLYFVFCFYFVKLMIHIVLEPPATIKRVKS